MSQSCPYIPVLPYSGFRERLRGTLGSQRIPLSGSIELNFRCNLRCKHCYVGHGHSGIPGKVELSTEEVKGIIDQLVESGCLWLLLSGGEVMLRRDFTEIYMYARRQGMLVTVYTNGTMLTNRVLDVLTSYRPFNLEITLYGYTQETYERVTGMPGSHRQCYRGIDQLVERGIPFRLKTVLMTLNWHELKDMQAYARNLRVNFRYDPLINGGIDGCGKPYHVRLPAKQVVEIEKDDPDIAAQWRQFIGSHQDYEAKNSLLYQCGAGMTSFHIDPYGELSLCMMARHHTYDLRQGTFQEGWDEFLKAERMQLAPPERACNSCKLNVMCSSCPGWSFTEHGDSTSHVDYLCEVTHLRAEEFSKPDQLIQIELPIPVEFPNTISLTQEQPA